MTRVRSVLDVKRVEPLVQIVAGLALNAFPAIFIAVFARIAPIEQQGRLAVSLAIGTYVAQLLSAFVVESRLATPRSGSQSIDALVDSIDELGIRDPPHCQSGGSANGYHTDRSSGTVVGLADGPDDRRGAG